MCIGWVGDVKTVLGESGIANIIIPFLKIEWLQQIEKYEVLGFHSC
jgi:hypothetical protein